MATPLHVLILEDNPADADLTLHALKRAGFDPIAQRVETESDFRERLHPSLQVILADFSMPQFDSLQALEILKECRLDIPFIIVSGTIGEERAVQAMQRGACDYIIKDRLARLGPAVQQALARGRLKEEKLNAERTLAWLAAIVETSGEAILTITLDGVIKTWNRAAESLYLYSAPEIRGKQIAVLFPQGRRQSDCHEDPEEIMKRLSQGEHIAAFETVCLRKDGRRVEVLKSLSPLRDSAGVVIGASAISLDITLRKRSERFLNAEQAVTGILSECSNLEEAGPRVLQTITETLRWEVAVLWKIDPAAKVLRKMDLWHARWADAELVAALRERTVVAPGMGVAGQTWNTGKSIWERNVIIDAHRGEASTMTQERMRGGLGLPIRQGAQMVGVMEFYHPELREPDRPLLTALDNIASRISQFCEKRQTEAAVRASEMEFRQLADAMPQIVWTAKLDGKIDYFNERCYQYAECSRVADLEQTWRSIVHPDDLPRHQDVWARAIQSGTPFEIEIRLSEGKTGRARWFLFRAVARRDAAGAVARWYGTATDIDDQKRSLETLRISEERFRTLVMALPAAVYTTDQSGLITLFNEQAVALWGRRPELGKDRWCGSWKAFFPDGSPLPPEQGAMAVTLRTGRGVRGEEARFERPDGSRAHVLPHPEPLRDASGAIVGAVNMVLDLTQTKQLEEQYRQAQKMEAIGQLAAGVAHDFNNLLTIILGYGEILLMNLPADDSSREPISQICKAGERAASLTRQLLAFGRKQILAPVVLDLNALITEIEKMLQRLIGADIELITMLQADLGRVKVDPGQVEQIIMNLVVNARDAMLHGGRLTIQTRNTTLSELQRRKYREYLPGPYTLLIVTDTGIGMDAATQARIFEPFFTTKEVGKGTGLGLATVFGIVKQSGGFIEVDSALGAGSTFRIYFPQIREAKHLKQVHHEIGSTLKGTETILLVEDEGGLGDLALLLLESSGYKVLLARNGSDAVRISNEYPHAIQLLFTDVVMPKMSGQQLAEILRLSRPDLKVLYMSGYTDDTMMRHGIKEAQTNFLPKPFTHSALVKKIRSVLDDC